MIKLRARLKGLLGLLITAGLAGCAGQQSTPQAVGPLEALHVLAMPVALNLDQHLGADGIAVKIFGIAPQSPKPVPIRTGTVEVLMFDGAVTGPLDGLTPLHTWTFDSEMLRVFESKSSIGIGYNLTLRWDNDQPRQKRITVVARYQSQDRPFLYSGRISISVVDV